MGSQSVCAHWMYRYYVLYLAWWWFKEAETCHRIFNIDYQYILLCYWLNKLLYSILKLKHMCHAGNIPSGEQWLELSSTLNLSIRTEGGGVFRLKLKGVLTNGENRKQNAEAALNLPVMTHIPINGFYKFRYYSLSKKRQLILFSQPSYLHSLFSLLPRRRNKRLCCWRTNGMFATQR